MTILYLLEKKARERLLLRLRGDCTVVADGLLIYQVDAFTSQQFGGNPAGVVPDAAGLSDAAMQLIAREMALSETAFVLPPAQPGADLQVRFFTPVAEVDLCGHATVATFWLLASLGRIEPGRLVQQTGAGLLPVEVTQTPGGFHVMMSQAPPRFIGQVEAAEVAPLLGCDPAAITGTGLVPEIVSTGLPDLIVPVRSRKALAELQPDMAAMAAFSRRSGALSLHVFALDPYGPEAVATCRDFSPVLGIAEEAATGTASGATGAYLVRHGVLPPGRFCLEQGVEMGRPSQIDVEVTVGGDGQITARVGGTAVMVLEGRIARPR